MALPESLFIIEFETEFDQAWGSIKSMNTTLPFPVYVVLAKNLEKTEQNAHRFSYANYFLDFNFKYIDTGIYR